MRRDICVTTSCIFRIKSNASYNSDKTQDLQELDCHGGIL